MRKGAIEAAAGKPTYTRLPTGAMLSHSIGDLVRATVYWMMGGMHNSSDFWAIPGLYAELENCFLDSSKPTNVENLPSSVNPDKATSASLWYLRLPRR